MKNKLLIIGASGHGKVVADIAMKMNKWQSIAFLDDNESIKSFMGIEVIGKSDDVFEFINDYDIFIGIGNNTIRENFHKELEAKGASLPTLIHPATIIGEEVTFGLGTVVMAGVIINCCSKIGKGCIINTSATIDHDNIVEDFVHVSPGVHIAGTVTIGRGSWLGIGSSVSNNVTIIDSSRIGAGAVVISDITKPGTYAGVPVKLIR